MKKCFFIGLLGSSLSLYCPHSLSEFKQLSLNEQMPIILHTEQLHDYFGITLFSEKFAEEFAAHLDAMSLLFGTYCFERLESDLQEKFEALKPHIDKVDLSQDALTGSTDESNAIIESLDIMKRSPSQRLLLIHLIAWQIG